jgi:AGZA family xanthine/uracil permease-like MFS transporter
VDTSLTVAAVNVTPELQAKLSDASAVIYHGMARFGGGAVLAGLMLGAIAVFIIDRDFRNATIYAVAAAVLSFFGLIHGTVIGVAVNLDIVVGYVLMAGITGLLAVRAKAPATEAEAEPGLATEAATP